MTTEQEKQEALNELKKEEKFILKKTTLVVKGRDYSPEFVGYWMAASIATIGVAWGLKCLFGGNNE